MALIKFDLSLKPKIEEIYRDWRRAQPKEPNQIGGKVFIEVEGLPGEKGFSNEFVDELERLGVPFECIAP